MGLIKFVKNLFSKDIIEENRDYDYNKEIEDCGCQGTCYTHKKNVTLTLKGDCEIYVGVGTTPQNAKENLLKNNEEIKKTVTRGSELYITCLVARDLTGFYYWKGDVECTKSNPTKVVMDKDKEIEVETIGLPDEYDEINDYDYCNCPGCHQRGECDCTKKTTTTTTTKTPKVEVVEDYDYETTTTTTTTKKPKEQKEYGLEIDEDYDYEGTTIQVVVKKPFINNVRKIEKGTKFTLTRLFGFNDVKKGMVVTLNDDFKTLYIVNQKRKENVYLLGNNGGMKKYDIKEISFVEKKVK